MKKFRVILFIAAGILLLGLFRPVHEDRAAGAGPNDPTIAVVARGTIRGFLPAGGNVYSLFDLQVKGHATGTITKLPIEVGQQVKKGDLLMEVDGPEVPLELKRSQAALALSKAKLAAAELALKLSPQEISAERDHQAAELKLAELKAVALRKKADQLAQAGAASPADKEAAENDAAIAEAELEVVKSNDEHIKVLEMGLDAKQAEVDMAMYQLDCDQIMVELAEMNQGFNTVNSPQDGMISAVDASVGEMMDDNVPICTISNLSKRFVRADVDETQIARVNPGQEVSLRAPAFPGERFIGKVVHISTIGVNTRNVVTFEVKIEITSDNVSKLEQGMSAVATIDVGDLKNVLLVPTAAIGPVSQLAGMARGGLMVVDAVGPWSRSVVVINPDGTQERRTIQIGLSDGDQTEVVRGLKEGEKVAYLPQ